MLSTINKFIETFDINTIISFYLLALKIFNSSPRIGIDHHFLITFLLPLTSLDSSGDENLFTRSRTCSGTFDFFSLTESMGVVTEERECITGGIISLECPPGCRQMFSVPLRPRVQKQTICSGRIKSRREKYLLCKARTSRCKRVRTFLIIL